MYDIIVCPFPAV